MTTAGGLAEPGGGLAPFAILVAALGGEGGGVLAQWLVQCAVRAGLPVQATSVPGVAQRTGATSYYVELLEVPLPPGAPTPVFALNPSPARVDVLIASEALEAARMIERGFVAPDRTVLIASTHRVYTTAEKMHLADGRYDGDRVARAAAALARRAVLFDMEAVAARHRTVLSAVMFGALSGSGVLPWSRELCEAVVKASGKGVAASLAGFDEAFRLAGASVGNPAAPPAPASRAAVPGPDAVRVLREAGNGSDLAPGRLEALAALPPTVQVTAAHGILRCRDYQDDAYATRYVESLGRLADAAGAAGRMPGSPAAEALDEAARQLALWMCFEDVIRVADLKTRAGRHERIRAESEAQAADVIRVVEYLKPGIEEIAATLPRRAGAAILALAARRPGLRRIQPGLSIRSSSLWGHLLLRLVARLAPWRPRSLRFAEEHEAMTTWLAALAAALSAPPEPAARFARELAGLPQVLKGYGETLARGRCHYARLWAAHVAPLLAGAGGAAGAAAGAAAPPDDAAWEAAAAALARATAATLADSDGAAAPPVTAAPPAAQTIRWIRRPRDGDAASH